MPLCRAVKLKGLGMTPQNQDQKPQGPVEVVMGEPTPPPTIPSNLSDSFFTKVMGLLDPDQKSEYHFWPGEVVAMALQATPWGPFKIFKLEKSGYETHKMSALEHVSVGNHAQAVILVRALVNAFKINPKEVGL